MDERETLGTAAGHAARATTTARKELGTCKGLAEKKSGWEGEEETR